MLTDAWLKAGVIDGKEMMATKSGTPQGGVISPFSKNPQPCGGFRKVQQLKRQKPRT
ncbi:hypothetical protein [Fischerella thermalis]|jgi:hypothetical protein|uniref:hypothetical protein n=1 Tax=Fischerella thermalis TaxID=372787 RepID=UPI001CA490ED|nr:hypothetical protein [Fischerella thermalis]